MDRTVTCRSIPENIPVSRYMLPLQRLGHSGIDRGRRRRQKIFTVTVHSEADVDSKDNLSTYLLDTVC